jgi:hypothetical protein
MRARSTLRILPRMGRMAWVRGITGVLGRTAGGVSLDDEQLGFASDRGTGAVGRACPGSPAPSSAVLATCQIAGALGGHARARAAWRWTSATIWFAFFAGSPPATRSRRSCWSSVPPESGWSRCPVWLLSALRTGGRANFTEMMAVRPSRMSSPLKFSSFSFQEVAVPGIAVDAVGQSLARIPSTCMPPSMVEIPLAKEWIESW